MAKDDDKPKGKKGADIAVDVSPGMDQEWRAKDALSTMMRAEEHKRDPDLMREVEKHRKQRMKELASIEVAVSPKTMKRK